MDRHLTRVITQKAFIVHLGRPSDAVTALTISARHESSATTRDNKVTSTLHRGTIIRKIGHDSTLTAQHMGVRTAFIPSRPHSFAADTTIDEKQARVTFAIASSNSAAHSCRPCSRAQAT